MLFIIVLYFLFYLVYSWVWVDDVGIYVCFEIGGWLCFFCDEVIDEVVFGSCGLLEFEFVVLGIYKFECYFLVFIDVIIVSGWFGLWIFVLD